MCAVAAAPPGKRRKKKGKRAEAVDASPLPEGQVQRQHRGLERRKEGRAEVPVDRLEEEGGRQQENGQQAGCVADGHHVSGRKRRREGAEGLGAEDGLPRDPPWHSCSLLDVTESEASTASPRKKKKKRRQQESRQEVQENELPEACRGETQRGPAIPGSQPSPAVNGRQPGDRAGQARAPRVSWVRDGEADVLQELLEYSSDKAYGRKVLTWDGEVSAVSQDAIQDSRWARAATVIDDWDEEFDRGKEKKVKKFKKEKKRTFNAFQKLQSRRNFWSVTHPAKATSLSYRR